MDTLSQEKLTLIITNQKHFLEPNITRREGVLVSICEPEECTARVLKVFYFSKDPPAVEFSNRGDSEVTGPYPLVIKLKAN